MLDNARDEEASQEASQQRTFAAYDKIILLATPHMPTLIVKRRQTVYKDHYGIEKLERWYAEIDYFIDNVLIGDDQVSEFLYLSKDRLEQQSSGGRLRYLITEIQSQTRQAARDLIEYRVTKAMAENGDDESLVSVDEMDPIDFEHYCAEILRSSGWDAQVTQASGDQGIDIIARLGSVKGVFQCKKYGQPVGNSAVQEIIAGKIFEQALFAAVVSNNSYTSSAKQLAAALDVHLLHYSELASFMKRISGD
jgi:restriction system protein